MKQKAWEEEIQGLTTGGKQPGLASVFCCKVVSCLAYIWFFLVWPNYLNPEFELYISLSFPQGGWLLALSLASLKAANRKTAAEDAI